ncbi:hypothetical protein AVEN_121569-1, partial [Araneus ventricosus]
NQFIAQYLSSNLLIETLSNVLIRESTPPIGTNIIQRRY